MLQYVNFFYTFLSIYFTYQQGGILYYTVFKPVVFQARLWKYIIRQGFFNLYYNGLSN
jgi:hypothetical protein